jgi:uncharacterized membrane protein YidH (DUF202 family)
MGEDPRDDLTAADDEEQPIYAEAVRKATRFSREFLATVISLLTTALGVVAALAWNTALTKALEESNLNEGEKVTGFFIYAVAITFIAVVVIVILGRLAGRIGAEPVEFKYPVKPLPPKD